MLYARRCARFGTNVDLPYSSKAKQKQKQSKAKQSKAKLSEAKQSKGSGHALDQARENGMGRHVTQTASISHPIRCVES